jgi:catechol 2,3-dioxygenase-like lactoylglutathione lyase family enzyme
LQLKEHHTVRIHHLGLTSRNIEQTAQFFVKHFGFEKVGGKPEYPSVFIRQGDLLLTIWQARDPNATFDRKTHLGLHHLALELDSEVELDALYDRLQKEPGVVIEFAPESRQAGSARHMMLYEPGGIRLEIVGS